jgi:carbon storage regulator
MLVLSRKKDEEIVVRASRPVTIGIAVVELRSDKVRIGIDAPSDCSVNRAEVQRRIDAEQARLNAGYSLSRRGDPPRSDEPVRDGQAGHVGRLRLMDDAREILARALLRFDMWMTSGEAIDHIRDHGQQLLAMADRLEQFTRSTAT